MNKIFQYPEAFRLTKHHAPSLNTAKGDPGIFIIPIPRQNAGDRYKKVEATVVAADAYDWEHISIKVNYRYGDGNHEPAGRHPTHREVEYIKDKFWAEYATIIQFYPKQPTPNPYTIHLWRPQKQKIKRPPDHIIGTNDDT